MKRHIKQIEDRLPTISESLKTWNSMARKTYMLRYYHLQKVLAKESLRAILDVGCGDGLLLSFVSRVGESDIYLGIDFSLTKILYAHRRVKGSKRNWREAYFILADAEHLPLRGCCVDAVVLSEVLEHLQALEPALLESRRVLRQDRKVIVTAPSAFKLHGGPLMSRIKNLILCIADKPPKKRETSLKIRNKTLPHTDFTRSELEGLLKRVFQITKLQSISFNYVYVVLKRLLPTNIFSRLIYYLDMAISEIPFFCQTGNYWLVMGEKHE